MAVGIADEHDVVGVPAAGQRRGVVSHTVDLAGGHRALTSQVDCPRKCWVLKYLEPTASGTPARAALPAVSPNRRRAILRAEDLDAALGDEHLRKGGAVAAVHGPGVALRQTAESRDRREIG